MESDKVRSEVDKLLRAYAERVEGNALEARDLEVLKQGLPVSAARIKGLEFPVSIHPLAGAAILADVGAGAALLQKNVRQTDGDGWWPPVPAGGNPPVPLPPGYGDIPLVNGTPQVQDWNPVNPTPNARGKVIELENGMLTLTSAGESVSKNWEEFKPPQPVPSSPLPPNPCPDGQPRPTFDQVVVEVDAIQASIREVNCHTTIVISITWKITRTRYRCSGLGRDREWRRDGTQPSDPPRSETRSNHRSTRVSLPQN